MEENYDILQEKYFPIPLDKLVPGRKRGFPLYIYLELNQRLVLRFTTDHELTDAMLRTHLDRGLAQFWCPREFQSEWRSYLQSEPLPETAQRPDATAEPPPQPDLLPPPEPRAEPEAEAEPAPEPRSEQSALAIDVLNSERLADDQKRTLLSEIGTEMLGLLATAGSDDPKEFEQAMHKCKRFTEDIVKIAAQSHRMSSIYDDIRMISETEIEHSAAVATLAVIFAMGVGFSEKELLADVAFASFLHDIGSVEIDPALFSVPVDEYDPEQIAQYEGHIDAGLKFLEQNAIAVTPAVREIISQHHERFDGHGFPKRIQGLQLNELAQIVSLADLFHDLMTGRMDGVTRGAPDALAALESLQDPASATPTHFNPELYHSVLQMIQNARNSKDKASRLAERVAEGL